MKLANDEVAGEADGGICERKNYRNEVFGEFIVVFVYDYLRDGINIFFRKIIIIPRGIIFLLTFY